MYRNTERDRMSPVRYILPLLAALSTPAFASSADLIAPLGKTVAGPRTEIMVLGTPHLAAWPKDYAPSKLTPLLDRLAAFKPDIITIESLSGEDCDRLARYPARYPNVWDQYRWDTTPARKATGLDVPDAMAAAEKALASPTRTPAERRRLAALFSAANDRTSALVQWLHLPTPERRPGDGLDDVLVDALTKRAAAMNENYQIAAVLAVRLGMDRVYPTDDHSADSITADLGPHFEKALMGIWEEANKKTPWMKDFSGNPPSDGDILKHYRTVNSPKYLNASIEGDFGAALKDPSPAHWGRHYVAWWETRNLRMVANMRSAFGNRPGARVLSIVGSSHKPYFDAYLSMMHDVKVLDTPRFLKH